MNVREVSKDKREVVAVLEADDLVRICNAIYYAIKSDSIKQDKYAKLYSDLQIARDLCQYGHLDNVSLKRIVKTRQLKVEGGKNERD